MEPPTWKDIEDIRREIREMRRNLYGDASANQTGLFARLDRLEEKIDKLVAGELAELRMDYRIALVRLKALGWGVGTTVVTLIIAVVVGIMRFAVGA